MKPMGFQPLVNRLLTVSLFSASCLGTLALFGAVPMLPRLTAQVAGRLPDLAQFAAGNPESQLIRQQQAWVAQLPHADRPPAHTPMRLSLEQFNPEQANPERSSAVLLRYRLPR